MKKHVLFIGLNDQDTKIQEIETSIAIEKVASIVGDCTISEAHGIYTHDNGAKVKETSLRVELLFRADKEVIKICKKLKKELNQESIALEILESNSTLI